jgi:hypothetical protein
MASLVGGDDVQPRGETEAHTSYERVRESDAGEVEIAVPSQELAHLILRSPETGECISERRRGAWPDASRRLLPEPSRHRRFK